VVGASERPGLDAILVAQAQAQANGTPGKEAASAIG